MGARATATASAVRPFMSRIIVATGWLLQAIGFDEGAIEHPPEIGFRIALLFGPGVGLMFILAALVFLWMPLTDARLLSARRIRMAQPAA